MELLQTVDCSGSQVLVNTIPPPISQNKYRNHVLVQYRTRRQTATNKVVKFTQDQKHP